MLSASAGGHAFLRQASGGRKSLLFVPPQCLAEKVPGRLIPLPREISAGCGLAWRMLPEEFEQWQNRLDPARYDQAAAVEQ